MCCLFGFVDYGKSLNHRQKDQLCHILSKVCEARGTHATGVAYHSGEKLTIVKKAVAGRKLKAKIPVDVSVVMGHTRYTTQGCKKQNYNNHPFPGVTGYNPFALAHNGVLYNDGDLRKSEKLPVTHIETDSYVAVQLLEKEGAVHHESLKKMAELVEGSFVFTVLDRENSIYFVRGENPLCIYHYEKMGLYVYASTEAILESALKQAKFIQGEPEKVATAMGDILRIKADGTRDKSTFENQFLGGYEFSRPPYRWNSPYRNYGFRFAEDSAQEKIHEEEKEYYTELQNFATMQGYLPEDVDGWIEEGFELEEIENFLYCGQYL